MNRFFLRKDDILYITAVPSAQALTTLFGMEEVSPAA
jgi:hypothetical protein